MKSLIIRLKSKVLSILKQDGGAGIWALADQAIVSLGTFTIGVALARHLDPSAYGAFALIMGTLYFLNQFHTSLVSYPISVRCASSSIALLRSTFVAHMRWTSALSVFLAMGMAGAVYVVGHPHAAPWAMGALVAWQLQETARRSLMAHLRHKDAIYGDALKFLLWAGATLGLILIDEVTLSRVLAGLILGCVAAGVLQAAQVGLPSGRSAGLRATVRESWSIGHWILFSYAFGFFTAHGFPWSLAIFQGLDATAHFQALILILGVANPVMLSVSNIVLPASAKAAGSDGLRSGRNQGVLYGSQGALLLLPYFIVLLIAPGQVLRIFFDEGSPYLVLTNELRMVVVAYCFIFVSQVLGNVLAGIGRPVQAFVGQIAGSAAAIVVALPLVISQSIVGASIGLVVVNVVSTVVLLFYAGRIKERVPNGYEGLTSEHVDPAPADNRT